MQENEIFFTLWCDIDGSDEKVRSRMNFLAVDRPQEVTSQGLLIACKVPWGGLI